MRAVVIHRYCDAYMNCAAKYDAAMRDQMTGGVGMSRLRLRPSSAGNVSAAI